MTTLTLYPKMKEALSLVMEAEAESKAWRQIAADRMKDFRKIVKASQIVDPDRDYSQDFIKALTENIRAEIEAERAENYASCVNSPYAVTDPAQDVDPAEAEAPADDTPEKQGPDPAPWYPASQEPQEGDEPA